MFPLFFWQEIVCFPYSFGRICNLALLISSSCCWRQPAFTSLFPGYEMV
jgi:hypothetical protein